MTKFSSQHFDLVIAQMLRSPTLTDLAIAKLDGQHLAAKTVGGNVVHAVMFNVIKKFVEEFKTLPDDASLKAEVQAYLNKYIPMVYHQQQLMVAVDNILKLRHLSDARGEGLARRIISYIVEVEIVGPAAGRLMIEAQTTGKFTGLAQKLQELEAQQQSVDGGRSFADILSLDMSDRGQRVPTHITWLDSRLGKGRGPVRGCGIGIIMPQANGKTSLGISMCVAQALSGQYTLLSLAEGGYDQSIKNKITGCALGIDYTLMEQMSIEQAVIKCGINPLLAAKKLESIKTRLHVLDLARLGGGIESVAAEISTMGSAGRLPVYTYVDWAGIMAARDELVASGKRSMESALKHISYTVADTAAKHNVMIAVSHQMAADNVKKGPFALNDQYCGAHCRGWTEPFKYAIIANPWYQEKSTKTRLNVATIAKSRDDQIQDRFVLQLRGELSTFQDVSSDWEIKGKNFKARTVKTKEAVSVS